MIFDKETMFCEGQAVTADAASTNYIDLGATGTPFGSDTALTRDIGKGSSIPLSINVVEAFNNATSVKVALQVDDNTSFSSASTVAERTYALAELAGGQLQFPDYIPEGANERYLRLYFDVTGTAPTTGKFTAGVVAGRQTNY
ncbi:MAG: hypothetical protein CL804_03470 [Citromicrobium sp.]|nr:hypothetical protein [Citromicrobium sp.]|tara:strand:- start:3087 stop:3515 length:429 start_codon:yes stop_codon:yes gene_type:complete